MIDSLLVIVLGVKKELHNFLFLRKVKNDAQVSFVAEKKKQAE